MIERRCSFLVVRTGKPSARSKRIWWPKTLIVPVPVRSDLVDPVGQDVVEQVEVLAHGGTLAPMGRVCDLDHIRSLLAVTTRRHHPMVWVSRRYPDPRAGSCLDIAACAGTD
jgi:hypothetical protein